MLHGLIEFPNFIKFLANTLLFHSCVTIRSLFFIFIVYFQEFSISDFMAIGVKSVVIISTEWLAKYPVVTCLYIVYIILHIIWLKLFQ
jgi:hypothetical protein